MVPIKHLVRKGASFWNVVLSLPAGKDNRTSTGRLYKVSPDHSAYSINALSMCYLRTVTCSNHKALVTDGCVCMEHLSHDSDRVPVSLCLQQI